MTSKDGGRVYRGRFFTVERKWLQLPDGRRTQVDVITHPPAATIVPVLDDGRLVLIRQYRPVLGEWLWELPAGKIDPDEDPEHGARRELEEETGYRAWTMKRMLGFYPAPGSMTEWMTVWVAHGLTRAAASPDDDEIIQVRRFSQERVRSMIKSGKIKDAKSLVGLLAYLGEPDAIRLPVAAAPRPRPARRGQRASSAKPRR